MVYGKERWRVMVQAGAEQGGRVDGWTASLLKNKSALMDGQRELVAESLWERLARALHVREGEGSCPLGEPTRVVVL